MTSNCLMWHWDNMSVTKKATKNCKPISRSSPPYLSAVLLLQRQTSFWLGMEWRYGSPDRHDYFICSGREQPTGTLILLCHDGLHKKVPQVLDQKGDTSLTTLQSMINVKLSKQRFGHFYENGLNKMIQTIPHNLNMSVKLTSLYCGLRLILILSKEKLTWH